MPAARFALTSVLAACLALAATTVSAQASHLPVTPEQRRVADQVASAGVPLSELAANAPDSHTVVAGDTLWDISKLFLKSPWRWPELWGMNRDQVRNPHLIYPGQILVLVKTDGRARLQFGQRVGDGPGDVVKLKPQMRVSPLDANPIPVIPLHLIQAFLTDTAVFDTDALATAPRIVAAQEGHVLLGRNDLAYARGDFAGATDFRVFRTSRPLRDPTTNEILGYEAPYVGTADLIRPGEDRRTADGKTEIVPATLQIRDVKQEVGIGDRLAPAPQRDLERYVPHAPDKPLAGQIAALYGDALNAGQNQIVALNRGKRDGVERGHVFALWRDGDAKIDKTQERPQAIKLPDERHGILFVFEVYERVSYALIISVKEPVKPGDRFTQP
ncbi:LysM peptidoglycan-binding domain-containing protein [Roseateles cellulosilyticus]|uniref:LysM peptidoglycan-binding domain-containing protein n=1 Tax=Pelomonas cellulosilytica TaxID=2906762 RepID=A0ABS8XXN4_9BURK|nr:LysM peptidoglycan-binding domain-containing protein [Pelomonas sp. P8]MCE4554070.1 LysM peptidoglycan-binding domain-containing protein [Pelomonas sp. P8]